MTSEDPTDAMASVGLVDLQRLSAAIDDAGTVDAYNMGLVALALATRAYLRRPGTGGLLSLTLQRDALVEAIKLIARDNHPTLRSGALDLAARLATTEAQRDTAIEALKRYGHCDATCTRQNMKGPCSCGFCRFADEGGLFDLAPTQQAPHTNSE